MLFRELGKDNESVVAALTRKARTLPNGMMTSLTWETCLELPHHKKLTIAPRIEGYICDLKPRYLPKGANLVPWRLPRSLAAALSWGSNFSKENLEQRWELGSNFLWGQSTPSPKIAILPMQCENSLPARKAGRLNRYGNGSKRRLASRADRANTTSSTSRGPGLRDLSS